MKIKLYNRDGAKLYLVRKDSSNEWKLEVDKEHDYVLGFIRVVGKEHAPNTKPENWEAIDPTGGPFIRIGDIFDNFRVVEFKDCTTLIMIENERANNI